MATDIEMEQIRGLLEEEKKRLMNEVQATETPSFIKAESIDMHTAIDRVDEAVGVSKLIVGAHGLEGDAVLIAIAGLILREQREAARARREIDSAHDEA